MAKATGNLSDRNGSEIGVGENFPIWALFEAGLLGYHALTHVWKWLSPLPQCRIWSKVYNISIHLSIYIYILYEYNHITYRTNVFCLNRWHFLGTRWPTPTDTVWTTRKADDPPLAAASLPQRKTHNATSEGKALFLSYIPLDSLDHEWYLDRMFFSRKLGASQHSIV